MVKMRKIVEFVKEILTDLYLFLFWVFRYNIQEFAIKREEFFKAITHI